MLNPLQAFTGRLADSDGVRKLIYHFCVYNFFTEALLLLERSKTHFNDIAQNFDEIVSGIREFWQITCEETAQFASLMKSGNHDIWAQYMWVKYPSG
jgi:hypothetical protein